MTYLDYNATAPLLPSVKETIKEALDILGNPSSVHSHGKKQKSVVENARNVIAEITRVTPDRLIFTSGATESNNMAIISFDGPIIVSATEHASVLKVRNDVDICPVNVQGILDIEILENKLKKLTNPALVCVMAANNETGVLQNIDEIVSLVHSYDSFLHCDAVQALGRCPLSFQALDSFSLSAHKLGGPFGVGILGINPKMKQLFPFSGGGQERSIRPGTENVIGISGFAKACEEAVTIDWSRTKKQKDFIETELSKVSPYVSIIGQASNRLPNTLMVSMPGIDAVQQLIQFDLNGVSISNGSACSSGKVKKSHVLKAMNLEPEIAGSCIRVSLCPNQPDEEIEHFIEVWCKIYEKAHKKSYAS